MTQARASNSSKHVTIRKKRRSTRIDKRNTAFLGTLGLLVKAKMPKPSKSQEELLVKSNEHIDKTVIAKGEIPLSLPPEGEGLHTDFSGLLHPPLNPHALISSWQNSVALYPNIEAMAQNIDGFGHKFTARVDLDGEDTADVIRQVIHEEKKTPGDRKTEKAMVKTDIAIAMLGGGTVLRKALDDITDVQVETKKKELAAEQRVELQFLQNFFTYAARDTSFIRHRKDSRREEEMVGNTYWEVLTNKDEDIIGFVRAEAEMVRISRRDKTETEYTVMERTGVLKMEKRKLKKKFRRYAIIDPETNRAIWFKEFLDPRKMDRRTGRFLDSEIPKSEWDDNFEANALIQFKLFSKKSPYGMPRWIGALLAVMGSRQTDEVNFDHFDNKAMPPFLILVSGGSLVDGDEDKIADYIENHIVGKDKYWRGLVLQATPDKQRRTGQSGQTRVVFQPLTQFQQKDALFQVYDANNLKKVQMMFRIPDLLLGKTKDFNRSTAEVAKQVSEEQVFAPERTEFDDWMNRFVLASLGIKHWEFKSKSVPLKDPYDIAERAGEMVEHGILLPHEARPMVEDAVGKNLGTLPKIPGHVPISLLKALAPLLGPALFDVYSVPMKLRGEIMGGGGAEDSEGPLQNGGEASEGEDEEDTGDKTTKQRGTNLTMAGAYIDGAYYPYGSPGDDPDVREAKQAKLKSKIVGVVREARAHAGGTVRELNPEELEQTILDLAGVEEE